MSLESLNPGHADNVETTEKLLLVLFHLCDSLATTNIFAHFLTCITTLLHTFKSRTHDSADNKTEATCGLKSCDDLRHSPAVFTSPS